MISSGEKRSIPRAAQNSASLSRNSFTRALPCSQRSGKDRRRPEQPSKRSGRGRTGIAPGGIRLLRSLRILSGSVGKTKGRPEPFSPRFLSSGPRRKPAAIRVDDGNEQLLQLFPERLPESPDSGRFFRGEQREIRDRLSAQPESRRQPSGRGPGSPPKPGLLGRAPGRPGPPRAGRSFFHGCKWYGDCLLPFEPSRNRIRGGRKRGGSDESKHHCPGTD